MDHSHARPYRRAVSVLTGLAASLAALGAATPAALAQPWPQYVPSHGHAPPQIRTILVGGTPGWQIALIALTAAVIAAAAAVMVDRGQARRRQPPAAATERATVADPDNSDLLTVTLSPGRW